MALQRVEHAPAAAVKEADPMRCLICMESFQSYVMAKACQHNHLYCCTCALRVAYKNVSEFTVRILVLGACVYVSVRASHSIYAM